MFASSSIESATSIASRTGKTGFQEFPDACRRDIIREQVRQALGPLMNSESLVIESRVFSDFTDKEPTPGTPSEAGIGQGDEVVEYTVLYKWQILTPFLKFIIGDKSEGRQAKRLGIYSMRSHILVKNEPFGTITEDCPIGSPVKGGGSGSGSGGSNSGGGKDDTQRR